LFPEEKALSFTQLVFLKLQQYHQYSTAQNEVQVSAPQSMCVYTHTNSFWFVGFLFFFLV